MERSEHKIIAAGKTIDFAPQRERVKRTIPESKMPKEATRSSDHWFRTFLWTIAIPGIAFVLFNALDDRRKERLDYVRQQIEKLYGPLYALSVTNHSAWNAQEPKVHFDDHNPPDKEKVDLWRRWSRVVFLKNIEKIEAVILTNPQYIEQPQLTGVFAEFFEFSASYRVIADKWKDDDPTKVEAYVLFANNKPPMGYPDALRNCAEAELTLLKYRMEMLEDQWAGPFFNLFENNKAKKLTDAAAIACRPGGKEIGG